MYLVLMAWLYVTLMVAIAEGVSPVGTWLGAFFTFVLYGVLPMAIVAYILNTPARKCRLRTRAAEDASPHPPVDVNPHVSNAAPDAGSETSAAPIAPIRKEP